MVWWSHSAKVALYAWHGVNNAVFGNKDPFWTCWGLLLSKQLQGCLAIHQLASRVVKLPLQTLVEYSIPNVFLTGF